jgi:transposase-like protein
MTTKRSIQLDEGRTLVRRWKASGKSQSEYCRGVGIKPQRLHYWRQRLAEDDQASPEPEQHFVAVRVREAVVVREAIEIVLTNGRVVRVRGAVDGELLRQVLAVTEARC